MIKVGMTGGVACGKSTVAKAFQGMGVTVLDADVIARDVVKKGQPALMAIAETFGNEYILPNGDLDRVRLGDLVFSDKQSLNKLEAITHPLIRQALIEAIEQVSRSVPLSTSSMPYMLVDIPLLIEKGYVDMFERILVIDCLPQQQLERMLRRQAMTEAKAKGILSNQLNREQRLAVASDIIANHGTKNALVEQVEKFHSHMLKEAAQS